MPVIAIDAAQLGALLGKAYKAEVLGEALEQIGCDVEDVVDIARHRCPNCGVLVEAGLGAEAVRQCGVCGYSQDPPFPPVDHLTVIRLDLLAARPDLFDIGGLARALKGFLGEETGLVRYEVRPSGLTVDVDPSVAAPDSYRPYIRCAVVEMPPLDDADLVTVMKLQENLHWGVGRARKLASIGVYDLDTVVGPIRYRTLDPDAEPFVPLGRTDPMTGRQILAEHPKGTAYAHLLEGHRRYPVLVDARGTVLSMPPIINSEPTKVRLGTSRLFVDVTGVSEAAVANSLHVLVCSLVELGGRVESVEVGAGEGRRTTPDLAPRSLDIEMERARHWLGLPLDADSLTAALERMRLAVAPIDEGRTRFRVTYPSFRSDVRHMVDLFEDLAIGYGYDRIEPALVPSMTEGGPRPAEQVSGLARQAMLGLGYSEVMSLPMTTEEDHYTRLRLDVPARYPRVGNPKLKALTVARTHLMGGVLAALRENRRRPVPIRLFELDDVFALDPAAPTGVRDVRRLCFAEVGAEAGYAAARSVLDALLRELGAPDGQYVPLDHPTFAAGRAARFQAGRFTGVIGEIHPEVVVGFGLDWPTGLVEVELAG